MKGAVRPTALLRLDHIHGATINLFHNHMNRSLPPVGQLMFPTHADIPHQDTVTFNQFSSSDFGIEPQLVPLSCFPGGVDASSAHIPNVSYGSQ